MPATLQKMIYRTGFWLLLPIAAIQGLHLRTKALRLPEATGNKSGACGLGEPLHLLAMGDSIIAGVGTGTVERSLPVQFAAALARRSACRVTWHVMGANGADISDLRKRLQQVRHAQKADVVLISIGVNNVTGLASKNYWKTQINTLTMELRSKWPKATVIFAGLPQMSKFPLPPQPLRFVLGLRASEFDAISAKLLDSMPGMLHVPTEIDPAQHSFCEDGFHPSADACSYWAEGLAQKFKSGTLKP